MNQCKKLENIWTEAHWDDFIFKIAPKFKIVYSPLTIDAWKNDLGIPSSLKLFIMQQSRLIC